MFRRSCLAKKTGVKKSRATVPLSCSHFSVAVVYEGRCCQLCLCAFFRCAGVLLSVVLVCCCPMCRCIVDFRGDPVNPPHKRCEIINFDLDLLIPGATTRIVGGEVVGPPLGLLEREVGATTSIWTIKGDWVQFIRTPTTLIAKKIINTYVISQTEVFVKLCQ